MSLQNTQKGMPGSKRPSEEDIGAASRKKSLSSAKQHRALKACDYCRKSKSKCFKPSKSAVACMRCVAAGHVCSLETEYRRDNPTVRIVDGVPHLVENALENPGGSMDSAMGHDQVFLRKGAGASMMRKIDYIYQGVAEILASVKPQQLDSSGSHMNSDVKLLLDAANSMKNSSTASPHFGSLSQGLADVDPTSAFSINKRDLASNLVPRADPDARLVLFSNFNSNTESPEACGSNGTSSTIFSAYAKSRDVSPLHLITRSMSDVPQPIARLLNLNSDDLAEKDKLQMHHDVISSGVLSENETIALMDDFRSNYGRWVSFPLEVPTWELIKRIRRKSSLLLTTCCSISLRYSLNGKPSPGDIDSHRRKKESYKLVIKHLVEDLNKSLLKYTSHQGPDNVVGDVEFLQAMVILSIYSMSLSSVVSSAVDSESFLEEDQSLREFTLDPWFLSGLGLSTFISKSTFGTLLQNQQDEGLSVSPTFISLDNPENPSDYQLLTLLRIYNHLILIHLVSCVLSGRMCLVDEIRLNHCTSALGLPSATNFDGRMVSEIGILLITYNFIQMNSSMDSQQGLSQLEANLSSIKDDVQAWYDQWEYLFEQPALQFVEFCYHFCSMQISYNYTFHKARVSQDNSMRKKSESSPALGPDVFESILESADDKHLEKIFFHSYSLTKAVLSVENDSYFAYLSDQIHFFFFYGAVSLLHSLKHLQVNEKLHFLNGLDLGGIDDKHLEAAFEAINVLVDKYDRVAQDNPNDIITKYKNEIKQCKRRLFPLYK